MTEWKYGAAHGLLELHESGHLVRPAASRSLGQHPGLQHEVRWWILPLGGFSASKMLTIRVNFANRTCLMLACQSGCLDVVKVLLDNDANVFSKDDRGLSAEDYALMAGHNDIVALLSADTASAIKGESCKTDQDLEIDSWNDSDDFSQGNVGITVSVPPTFVRAGAFLTTKRLKLFACRFP